MKRNSTIVSAQINPRRIIASIAFNQIGLVFETSRNHGPGIEALWGATTYATGYENREPWCAAFVADCVKKARASLLGSLRVGVRPDFPDVKSWERWGRSPESGCEVLEGEGLGTAVQAGDIVIFRFSHIGIVREGSARVVLTVEGNTQQDAGGDMQGVFARTRRVEDIKCVLRLPVCGVAEIKELTPPWWKGGK